MLPSQSHRRAAYPAGTANRNCQLVANELKQSSELLPRMPPSTGNQRGDQEEL